MAGKRTLETRRQDDLLFAAIIGRIDAVFLPARGACTTHPRWGRNAHASRVAYMAAGLEWPSTESSASGRQRVARSLAALARKRCITISRQHLARFPRVQLGDPAAEDVMRAKCGAYPMAAAWTIGQLLATQLPICKARGLSMVHESRLLPEGAGYREAAAEVMLQLIPAITRGFIIGHGLTDTRAAYELTTAGEAWLSAPRPAEPKASFDRELASARFEAMATQLHKLKTEPPENRNELGLYPTAPQAGCPCRGRREDGTIIEFET